MRNELQSSISMLHSRIDHLEDSTDDLEKQMTEYTAAYNDITDAHDQHTEEIRYLQAKVADLEDRSRGNNIKFWGNQRLLNLLTWSPTSSSYFSHLFLNCDKLI